MAVPKRKTSRSNTRSRRSQWKATPVPLVPVNAPPADLSRGPGSRRRSRALIALSAAPLVVFTATPAFADHTPQPGAVTLVGSLQSELGCPGDWQPDCVATQLLPVAGSPGVYQATFDIPAGDHAFKVALNGSWDENYGAGGAAGGANLSLTAPGGPVTFTYDHATHVIADDLPEAVGAEAGSHWLTPETIAWELGEPAEGTTYRLYSAPDGGLARDGDSLTGGDWVELQLAGEGLGDLAAEFPHLSSTEALRVPPEAQAEVKQLLKGQVVVAAVDRSGAVTAVTGVQTAGVLDEVYAAAAGRELALHWRGKKPRLDLWAPTARTVAVHVFTAGSGGDPVAVTSMSQREDGTWTVTGDAAWKGAYYLYEVEVFVPETGAIERNLVTDPYSVGLSTNSERSLLVDLDDPALAPAGWQDLAKPPLAKPEDLSIYELHLRDFSITDETVPAEHRGTYKAFTDTNSDGMRHLADLAKSGLNAVHLLPVNDIATIEERARERRDPACDLAALPPDSEQQQECVAAVAPQDGYDWGYDPLHYTTPEGSYSTAPEGATRTVEFREMVSALNRTGLRVVQDVVYNHTSSAGQAGDHSLDRIVPGYYHRLNPTTGAVETSTCCPNTATENVMMGKLMVDSVVTLAKTYKLDGFRFDLMGHHSKQNMLDVRAALDTLTLRRMASTARASTSTERAGTSARSLTTPVSSRPRRPT